MLARATEALTEYFGKAFIDRFLDNPRAPPWKIAVEDRAEEIGVELGGIASIAAMCEVWTNREQDILLHAWGGGIAGRNSNISERMLRSSGLLTDDDCKDVVLNGGESWVTLTGSFISELENRRR